MLITEVPILSPTFDWLIRELTASRKGQIQPTDETVKIVEKKEVACFPTFWSRKLYIAKNESSWVFLKSERLQLQDLWANKLFHNLFKQYSQIGRWQVEKRQKKGNR